MDIEVPKLLGGVANGQDVPPDWEMISEWIVPGTELKSIYERRAYIQGENRYIVWTDVTVNQQVFETILFWHRETHRSEQIASQRSFLQENMEAAKRYNEVVTAIGFAGLFTLWTQLKGTFAPFTSLSAVLLLCVAIALFVGWELFGMHTRASSNLGVAKALSASEISVMQALAQFRESQSAFIRKYEKVWKWLFPTVVVSASASGLIMLCAIVHGAWLAL